MNGCALAVALLLAVGIATLAFGFRPVGLTATALSWVLIGVGAWRQGGFGRSLGSSFERQHAPVRFWSLLAFVMILAGVATFAAYQDLSEALGG